MQIHALKYLPGALLAALLVSGLSGCGERVGNVGPQTETPAPATEAQTQAPVQTEKVTEKPKETESETQKLITSVDYTSKDGTVKITLPDNTWKVTQDADEMRVFQSGNSAIINIVHASTETAMKNLSVMRSQEELKASLDRQYTGDNAYEIINFISAKVGNVDVYRYTVKYNAAARMWAYAVTNAIVAADQAYIVTGTVTDENDSLLEAVRKAVESFRVLKDDQMKAATGEVISGTAQKTSETVNTGTSSSQELTSLAQYGASVKLVTTDTVNVRSQPGTDSSILTTLQGKTEVTVIGETKNWFKINISGNEGFIRKDFLVYPSASTNTQTESTETASRSGDSASAAEINTATNYGSATTLYASDNVNIRSQPGTDSSVAGALSTGTAVSVIGETDNWFIVSVGGTTGYVSKAYLTYDNSISNGSSADQSNMNGGGSSGGSSGGSAKTSVSGTVTGTTVDTITIAGDDGNTYTIYYGDASTSTQDGLYSGVYVSVSLDSSQASGDGTLYATSVTGY